MQDIVDEDFKDIVFKRYLKDIDISSTLKPEAKMLEYYSDKLRTEEGKAIIGNISFSRSLSTKEACRTQLRWEIMVTSSIKHLLFLRVKLKYLI